MKKVYYLDISNVNLSDINVKIISERKLNKTKLVLNEKKKIQTLCAYLLLRFAFKEFNFELNDYIITYQNNKPVIEEVNYSFNITHSNNIVAICISDNEIGIDCEMIDLNKDLSKVINYTFSKEEYIKYLNLEDKDKHYYFYKKWVLKEAYFKMKGIGLTKKFKDVTINNEVLELKDSQNNHYYLATNPSVSEIIKVEFKTINI